MIRPGVSPEFARWVADVGPVPWVTWGAALVWCMMLRGRR